MIRLDNVAPAARRGCCRIVRSASICNPDRAASHRILYGRRFPPSTSPTRPRNHLLQPVERTRPGADLSPRQGLNWSALGPNRSGCDTNRCADSTQSQMCRRVSRGSTISSIWKRDRGPNGPRALSMRAFNSARNATGSSASASCRLYAASIPPSGGIPPTSAAGQATRIEGCDRGVA